MIRFLAARALLLCYSVIALAGQGLHGLIDDHGHDCECTAAATCSHSHAGHSHATHSHSKHTHCHSHGSCEQAVAKHTANRANAPGLQTPQHAHDCDHCAVCQHQSLGQMFVAAPPAETRLAVCEQLSERAPPALVCPALFSPAQPRAPPVA